MVTVLNNKPRREAGLYFRMAPARDRESGARVGKRVGGFEPPTFTLGTCRSTTELHPQGACGGLDGSSGITVVSPVAALAKWGLARVQKPIYWPLRAQY